MTDDVFAIDFDDYKYKMPCENCNGSGEVTCYDSKRLGAILQKQRKHSKIKLREVARAMKFSIGYISDLEHGRRQVTSYLFTTFLIVLDKLEKQSESDNKKEQS